MIIVHKSSFCHWTLINKTTKRSFYRDTSKFTKANVSKSSKSRANLSKKIASADWSPMYQQNNANSTFEKFSNMFENVQNNIAPIKVEKPSSKSTKKKWLSRELLNLIREKHILFNIWKEKADVEKNNSYKIIRNSTNRPIRTASNNYSQKLFKNLLKSKHKSGSSLTQK